MKKIFIKIILIGVFLIACQGENNVNKKMQYNAELHVKKIDKKLLNGVWGVSPNENAVFEISKDSIRYVEFYDKPYYFKIKNDTFIIFFDDGYLNKNIIRKLTKDSLVLYNYELKENHILIKFN